jgi:hypothetical protein
VLPAIHFDQQLSPHAGEIGYVFPDWDLPLELDAFQAVCAQPIPKPPLGIGHIRAQSFGKRS